MSSIKKQENHFKTFKVKIKRLGTKNIKLPDGFEECYNNAFKRSIRNISLSENDKSYSNNFELVVINKNRITGGSYKTKNFELDIFSWIKIFRDYYGITLLQNIIGIYAVFGIILILREFLEMFKVDLKDIHAKIVLLLYDISSKKSKWLKVDKLIKDYYLVYGKKFDKEEFELYLAELKNLEIIDYEIDENIVILKEKVIICK
jgi:hypothetical protein